jgi:hypothetical protein
MSARSLVTTITFVGERPVIYDPVAAMVGDPRKSAGAVLT